MARIDKNSILNHFTGRIGPISIRSSDGKKYAVLNSGNYSRPDTPEYRLARDNFAFRSSLCSCLNSIGTIRSLWGETGERIFNKMMSRQLKTAKDSMSLPDFSLIPLPGDFPSVINGAEFSGNVLIVTINPLPVLPRTSKWIIVQGVLLVSSPVSEDVKNSRLFLPFFSGLINYTRGEEINAETSFKQGELRLYSGKEILIHVSVLDKDLKTVSVSEDMYWNLTP